MKTLLIAGRVVKQLQGDRRFLALSIVAPLIIIYFLKLLFDTFPPLVPVTDYTIPLSAFIVHFISFILCAILLVQERTKGTLERMLISGFKRTSIIGGYTIGYFGLATLQAASVLLESIWLFRLDFSYSVIFMLFIVTWLLAIVSVMLGIFISTFARHEGHVFPFIPLIMLPSVFLTGLIIDPNGLPVWASFLGKCLPLYYAVKIIREITSATFSLENVWLDFTILTGFIFILWLSASLSLKESE